MQKRSLPMKTIEGPYYLQVILAKSVKIDADNSVKAINDFLQRIGVVANDKLMHSHSLLFGEAPIGVRLRIQQHTDKIQSDLLNVGMDKKG